LANFHHFPTKKEQKKRESYKGFFFEEGPKVAILRGEKKLKSSYLDNKSQFFFWQILTTSR
jgi:hypothetical protein